MWSSASQILAYPPTTPLACILEGAQKINPGKIAITYLKILSMLKICHTKIKTIKVATTIKLISIRNSRDLL